jgi:hypothetical protein
MFQFRLYVDFMKTYILFFYDMHNPQLTRSVRSSENYHANVFYAND